MDVVIYRRESIQTFKATILSIAEGVLIEDDLIQYDDIENLGLRYDRGAYSTNPDDIDARCYRNKPMVIVKPEELDSILLIKVDGTDIFIRNNSTGELDCKIEAILEETLLRYEESLLLDETENPTSETEKSISQSADGIIGADELEDDIVGDFTDVEFDESEFMD